MLDTLMRTNFQENCYIAPFAQLDYVVAPPRRSIEQSVARLTVYPGVTSSNPSSQVTFMEIDHEIISTVILPHPLIQEGQLSVTG